MLTVTKSWRDLPAAHRQPNHDGHCRFIHGHNWRFDITFHCERLDESGFVVYAEKLGKIKDILLSLFDHTLLINGDDPSIQEFEEQDRALLLDLVIVKDCGMEGLAELVANKVQGLINETIADKARGLVVMEVVCWEDSENWATYKP